MNWLWWCLMSVVLESKPVVRLSGTAQGTDYHIVYCDPAKRNFQRQVDSIFTAIDLCLSTYRTDSDISVFNTFGAFRFQSGHFYAMLRRASAIYAATGGAFDPTVMPLTEAYRKGKRTGQSWLGQIDSLLQYVGFQYIRFDSISVQALKPNVRLDFDAIAQGYTVDVIAAWLTSQGIRDYMVEVGGELYAHGRDEAGKNWFAGVESPLRDSKEVYRLPVEGKGMATSGNYRNFYQLGADTFRHIIHPKTGLSRPDPLLSATLLAPDAATADAYATACMAIGLDSAKTLLAQHPELQALLIYRNGQDSLAVFRTSGMASPPCFP
ncbi:FAD:protein FMN transferase [Chitinophaga lutea]